MLSFDFDYYKPVTIKEALDLFQQSDRTGKQPMFFSGGTELITLGRIDLAFSGVVIDIKDIKELRAMRMHENNLVLGSALSLTKIEEANPFPLLTKTISEIADHTARGKITLGGNICAQIYYREAVLPFLLCDSHAVIAGPNGVYVKNINEIFKEHLKVKRGELLLQLITDQTYIEAPYISVKKRQNWNIGYPLITAGAILKDGKLRLAISGLCPFPFRSLEAEEILNNRRIPIEDRIKKAIEILPGPILNDVEGSSEYRLFVLENLLQDIVSNLGQEV